MWTLCIISIYLSIYTDKLSKNQCLQLTRPKSIILVPSKNVKHCKRFENFSLEPTSLNVPVTTVSIRIVDNSSTRLLDSWKFYIVKSIFTGLKHSRSCENQQITCSQVKFRAKREQTEKCLQICLSLPESPLLLFMTMRTKKPSL